MTNLEEIRWKIGDQLHYDEQEFTADGSKTVYILSFTGIQDLTVTDNGVAVLATAYTLDVTAGTVVFDTAPTDAHTIKFVYKYGAFTDTQLTAIIAAQSDVHRGAMFCIDALMADSAKRFSYTQGQTTMKVGEVFDHLERLKKALISGKAPIMAVRTNRFYNKDLPDKTDLSRTDLGDPSTGGDLSRV